LFFSIDIRYWIYLLNIRWSVIYSTSYRWLRLLIKTCRWCEDDSLM
jgi:hypothetical protein